MGLQGRLVFLNVLFLVGMIGLPKISFDQRHALISLAILLVALPAGIYLAGKTQIFNPRGQEKESPAQAVVGLAVKPFGDKFFVELPASSDAPSPPIKMQISPNQVVELGGQEATGSAGETPKVNGYIVELKNDPLVKYQTAGVRVQATTDAYKATLTSEHENAKKDILSRLGKKAVVSIQKSTEETLALLGDYTGVFNGFALDISETQAEEVKKSPFVKNVSPNYEIKTSLLQSVPLINADDVWQLTDSQERKVTGEGTTIAIIDTGIDYTHSDLGGCLGTNCKVIGGYDFVNKDDDPKDDNGHGTHVASIAAGNGVLKGVAPGAKLVGYKILAENGGGYSSDLISALERSADPNQDGDFADHWDVVNMSLGGWGNPDDPMSQATDNTVSAGVVVAVAAGNRRYPQTIQSPGTSRKAITVGATDKADSVALFSSRGPVIWNGVAIVKPDVAAPGVDICAAQYNDSWYPDKRCVDNDHVALSGTSMAAPHVAGTVALIKQKHPNWSPEQIKSALKSKVQNVWGKTVTDRGSGRIDALAAVNASDPPPIAELDPISLGGNNRTISGRIETQNLKTWSLAYKSLGATASDGGWIEVAKSTSLPTNGEFGTIQTVKIVDGDYVVRLLVEDTNGQTAIDYGFLHVDKLWIRNPQHSDTWRAGDEIPLDLVLYEGTTPTGWTLEYGNSSYGYPPTNWLPASGGPTKWNTAGLSEGWYGIRITMEQKFEEEVVRDSDTVIFYLDSTLREGWPQRVPWSEGYGANQFLEPVVSDLDNDGKKEIIVFTAGNPPKLLAFQPDGTVKWTANVGGNPMFGGNLHVPLVVDLNNDGKQEVVAYNIGPEGTESYSELYAFDSSGQVVSGWPVRLPKIYKLTLLAADLNRDGSSEIVLRGDKHMAVLKSNREIMSQWNLVPTNLVSVLEGTPAVGNFDDDSDLEIVVARPSSDAANNDKGEIHVFNMNGSEVSGWPIETPGFILSSPAVGDLDGDSFQEIAVGLLTRHSGADIQGGFYVFDRKGKILPGWPQARDYAFWSSPSIGDLDGDGDLEIGAANWDTWAFNHDGTPVVQYGWPTITGESTNLYYSSIMGDLDSDKKADLATNTGAGRSSGVIAWSWRGSTAWGGNNIFWRRAERFAGAPPVMDDLDGDGNLEVITSSDSDFNWGKYVFKGRGSLYVWGTSKAFDRQTMHWPTFHHDVQRTGMHIPPVLNAVISGKKGSYRATARGENLAWTRIYWAKADSDLTKRKSWTSIGGNDCSEGSTTCTATGDFTPPGAGSYWLTGVASDRKLGPCSGNPKWASVPGWKDCGELSRVLIQVSPRACIQVITPAKNDQTGECREFPTPCDIPEGWTRVASCEATPITTPVPPPLPSPASTPAPISSSPTGTISGPSTGRVGQNLTYTSQGNGSDPQTVSMHWAKADSDLTRGESWHFIAKSQFECWTYAAAGVGCGADGIFTPTEADTYYVSVVVVDNKDGPCSGNPKWDSVPVGKIAAKTTQSY